MFLRIPGGKYKNRHKILKYFPESYKEYREPFCGSSGIFFSIDIDKKRWINDINPDLISVYYALRDRPEEFIFKCKTIEPHQSGEELTASRENGKSKKRYNKRLKDIFDKMVLDPTLDSAFRFFFINRTVWAGRVNYNDAMKSRMYFSNPEGWNIIKTHKLEKVAEILKNTKITNFSYEECLFTEPENGNSYEDVICYIDPPYFVETEMKQTDKLYQYGFSYEDHKKFAENLYKCSFKWVLSYDDNNVTRSLFKNFNIHEEEWAYCGSSQKKKKIGKELIITNF